MKLKNFCIGLTSNFNGYILMYFMFHITNSPARPRYKILIQYAYIRLEPYRVKLTAVLLQLFRTSRLGNLDKS